MIANHWSSFLCNCIKSDNIEWVLVLFETSNKAQSWKGFHLQECKNTWPWKWSVNKKRKREKRVLWHQSIQYSSIICNSNLPFNALFHNHNISKPLKAGHMATTGPSDFVLKHSISTKNITVISKLKTSSVLSFSVSKLAKRIKILYKVKG